MPLFPLPLFPSPSAQLSVGGRPGGDGSSFGGRRARFAAARSRDREAQGRPAPSPEPGRWRRDRGLASCCSSAIRCPLPPPLVAPQKSHLRRQALLAGRNAERAELLTIKEELKVILSPLHPANRRVGSWTMPFSASPQNATLPHKPALCVHDRPFLCTCLPIWFLGGFVMDGMKIWPHGYLTFQSALSTTTAPVAVRCTDSSRCKIVFTIGPVFH